MKIRTSFVSNSSSSSFIVYSHSKDNSKLEKLLSDIDRYKDESDDNYYELIDEPESLQ